MITLSKTIEGAREWVKNGGKCVISAVGSREISDISSEQAMKWLDLDKFSFTNKDEHVLRWTLLPGQDKEYVYLVFAF
jgi:hypothetical protein